MNSSSSASSASSSNEAAPGTPEAVTVEDTTATTMTSLSPTAQVAVAEASLAGAGGSGGDDIPNDPGKMFIGGLSWQTSPESIREYFSAFGELAEVMVMKDPATRRSRGFGFITFSDPRSVDEVLKFPVHQLDGKLVEPKVAVPRKTNPKLVMRTRKIFVGGLSSSTSLEDIKAYFEQFSKVKEAMLAYDKITNRHRGFGFVTFDNEDVVDKICEIHFHEINGKMVESKKALPKEPRLAYYNNFYGAPMGMGGYGPMGGRGFNSFGGNPYGGMRGGGGGGGNPYSGYGPMGGHHGYDHYNSSSSYGGSHHHRGGDQEPASGRGGSGGGGGGHLLQMGHFNAADNANNTYSSNYDNEMRYYGNKTTTSGNVFGNHDRQPNSDYSGRFGGGSSPSNTRSAFNNYRAGGGESGSRIYDNSRQQHSNGLDSGNGLGLLSNGYYGGGGGSREYNGGSGGGREYGGGGGGRFNNGNYHQQQQPQHASEGGPGTAFNDDDFPELSGTASKFNTLRLNDEAGGGLSPTPTDGLTRAGFGGGGPGPF